MKINKITKEEYPELLKQISGLPIELNYIGKIPDDSYKFLCIVGSRKYSEYGRDVCKKLISGLKKFPIVIVSGLALGIDSIAHECALENDIKTIAFPGSGLETSVIYPYCHLGLAKRIVDAGGALISPFPNNLICTMWTFPVRNRLMAGISHATLIIEAKKGSGTLITSSYALEFNREVMAVPGSIFNDLSYGPHMLIGHGSRPVFRSEDILEALGFLKPQDRIEPIPENLFENVDFSAEEKLVVEELKIQNLQASELAYKTELTPAILNTTLSKLEIREIIRESGGVYSLQIK